MKTIFEYIKPQFKKLFWGLSIKFIGTSMDLCIPWILAYMIDNIISKKNIKEIYLWGVLMIICSFIGVFANIYANRNASAVGRICVRHGMAQCKCMHIKRSVCYLVLK